MVRLILALLLAAASAAAPAQSIVKCVDADGNVTYQDGPCSKGTAGRNMEMPKAETREDTAAWEEAARAARIVPGMPKRWVLRSRNAPTEIRPPAAREDATEVWRYEAKDGDLLVGFAGANVAWVRVDTTRPAPTQNPSARVAPKPQATTPGAAPAAAAASESIKGAQNRKFVLPGRYCEHVFAEIGPADREEALAAGAAPSSGTDTPPAGGAPRRYFYDPAAGDPSMRTAFTCVDGKVADVERTMAP